MSDQPSETAPEPPPEFPRVEVSKAGSVGFHFCNVDRVGTMPALMLCMSMRRERDAAFGWSEEARDAQRAENQRAEAAGEEPALVLDPDDMDGHAVFCVYASCLGLVWPDGDGAPSFRKHRHKVIPYGEAVLDWLLRKFPVETSLVLADTRETGRALYEAMAAAYIDLFAEADQAAGFTGGTGGTG